MYNFIDVRYRETLKNGLKNLFFKRYKVINFNNSYLKIYYKLDHLILYGKQFFSVKINIFNYDKLKLCSESFFD